MKKLLILYLLLCFTLTLPAQLRLNVDGDAKITGQLDLSSPGSNLFIGLDTGESITTGQNNTFIGLAAGAFNTEGESNTFIGLLTGFFNNIGHSNTFVGMSAGLSNTEGTFNTFLGKEAGRTNNTGYSNTFIGGISGYSNTTGFDNTFLGVRAGYSNTTGSSNTFIGVRTGNSNTTGFNNIFLGPFSGQDNISGANNAFLGTFAGSNNTTGSDNTFLGIQAGSSNNTGRANTFVGWSAGFSNTTGSNLTAFGYNVAASLSGNGSLDNSFAFGSNAIMTQSNTGVLGNVSMQQIGGYVNWGTASDIRMKTDVREDVKGVDFVLQLHPVSYRIDAVKLNEWLRSEMEEQDRSPAKRETQAEKRARAAGAAAYQKALEAKSRVRYTGFIAQEVEEAAAATGFAFSGIVKPVNQKDHYSLRYAEFVVPLVKAVQEQQEMIEQQKKENTAQEEKIKFLEQELKTNSKNQQQQISELRSLVEQLLAGKPDSTEGEIYELTLGQKAMLAQNQPNPFQQKTVVQYFVPEDIGNALIQLTSADGKILGTVKIRQAGKGQVNINTETYPAGIYYYSLVLDGQVFETKRMVLAR